MKPRKHQQDALSALSPALSKVGSRATVAMACGTGKTLIGVRAIEAALAGNDTANIIVFVPNLPLLDQISSDWVKLGAFGGDFIMLPVASVGSSLYGEDSIDHLEGLNKEARNKSSTKHPDVRSNTNDSLVVAEALLENRRTVIFCTYQSSAVIQYALMELPGFSFDAAIMDEAHRTAGSGKVQNSPYQLCLSDDLIAIDRRLFMTATPRVHKARNTSKGKNKFNSADELLNEYIDEGISMTDISLYGNTVYEFSFAQAIAASILSDYRVFAIAITDKELRAAAENNLAVSLEGVDLQNPDISHVEAVASAKNLALSAAVSRMVTQGAVSGAIAFHRDTKRSRRFTTDLKGFLSTHPHTALSNSVTAHVAGVTPQVERQRIMSDFDAAHKQGRFALISNCSVLGEGIDVPEMDTIVFADPKHSKTSIVQAVGRVIRRDPQKPNKVASVIIPVFVGDTEDPDEMVDSSAFSALHEIITALRENDNMKSYFTDAILNDTLGTGNGEGDEPDSVLISVQDSEGNTVAGEEGSPINLVLSESAGSAVEMSDEAKKSYKRFAKSCESKMVGENASPFERNLAKLKAYKALHGHCRMTANARINGFPIGKVMADVQNRFHNGDLPEAEREAYSALGADLTPIDDYVLVLRSVIGASRG